MAIDYHFLRRRISSRATTLVGSVSLAISSATPRGVLEARCSLYRASLLPTAPRSSNTSAVLIPPRCLLRAACGLELGLNGRIDHVGWRKRQVVERIVERRIGCEGVDGGSGLLIRVPLLGNEHLLGVAHSITSASTLTSRASCGALSVGTCLYLLHSLPIPTRLDCCFVVALRLVACFPIDL